MLLSFWSPKGGVGTSVVAAACALVCARHSEVRLADFGGDQPAILGLASPPSAGVTDWLATGPLAPPDALDRLAVPATDGLTLLPRGTRPLRDAGPESGAALAVVLSSDHRLVVADVAAPDEAAARALVECSDVSVVVLRDCYLALRRTLGHPLTAGAAGVVVLEEPRRALGAHEIADVLGLPVLARLPVADAVARAVDAGTFAARMPEGVERRLRPMIERFGLDGRAGRAA
jgi:MinD-like ATPase involved in chromosome partitioning or flagellar assembly